MRKEGSKMSIKDNWLKYYRIFILVLPTIAFSTAETISTGSVNINRFLGTILGGDISSLIYLLYLSSPFLVFFVISFFYRNLYGLVTITILMLGVIIYYEYNLIAGNYGRGPQARMVLIYIPPVQFIILLLSFAFIWARRKISAMRRLKQD